MGSIVIVGAGLAGGTAARTLREEGHEGPITLIGSEPHPPYNRPPLSKDLLAGAAQRDSVFVATRDWYAENGIELLTGETVAALDPAAHEVRLESGRALRYTPRLGGLGCGVSLQFLTQCALWALTFHLCLVLSIPFFRYRKIDKLTLSLHYRDSERGQSRSERRIRRRLQPPLPTWL